ncbi:MAG: carbon starvation CstA family protein, partial [Terriglobia bacterium]
LGEWLGDWWVGFKNPHVTAIVSMLLALLLVLSGTWIYLWQLFGASNQLMAALSLLIVTLWLRSTGRNPAYAMYPMLFMYVTTMAATLVTAYNLYASVLSNPNVAKEPINTVGAIAMIAVAALLFIAALIIAWDAWKAWRRMTATPAAAIPAPALASK